VSIDFVASALGRCAPEIVSATAFLLHRKFPDVQAFEDIMKRLSYQEIDEYHKKMLRDLVDFDQMKRDFEAALLICVSGYCILIAVNPTRLAAIGVLVWVVGGAITRGCFSLGTNEERYRRRWVLLWLYGMIQAASLTAKVALSLH